jgi:AcrR family transcriptional regulator
MNSPARRRRYDAPHRRAQAAGTRSRIAASAQRLFVERGYRATTVEAIAQAAGVGTRTIYDAFGSKRGVLFALLEHFAPIGREDFEAEIQGARNDPEAQLNVIVQFVVRYYAHAAEFLELLRTAASDDPDLLAVTRAGEAARRDSQREAVGHWARAGALRQNVSRKRAQDILWALTSPDLYRLLVHDSGWTQRRYESWLKATLAECLFRQPQPAD